MQENQANAWFHERSVLKGDIWLKSLQSPGSVFQGAKKSITYELGHPQEHQMLPTFSEYAKYEEYRSVFAYATFKIF